MASEYQPRYVAYARKHGRSPEDQLDSEYGMTGFILFINGEVAAFRKERPDCFCGQWVADHQAFTDFIDSRYPSNNDQMAIK